MAEENREHISRAFRAEQVMRGTADTGPMPAVVPQPRSHKRPNPHGLHIVKGYAAAALLWALKGTFGAVKAHKVTAGLGLAFAALLIAMMPPTKLNDHALVVNQPPVATGSADLAPGLANLPPVHHARHRGHRQHRAVMSRRP